MMNSLSMGSTFNSEDHPASLKAGAWEQAIDKLGFASEGIDELFTCCAAFVTSPLGLCFARLSSSAQVLARKPQARDDAVLLVLLNDGEIDCESDGRKWSCAIGDIFLAPSHHCIRLSSVSGFQALIVSIPRAAFNSRLGQAKLADARLIKGQAGAGKVLSSLLGGLSETLDTIGHSALRPLDLLLLETIVAATEDSESVGSITDIAGARSLIMRRVCRSIELELANRNLNLRDVARREGISPRYLQKLFEKAGESFSHYLLNRRLDRCADHLVDARCDALSISEICFTWGFSDAAHFSRAFRERFGKSPTDFRKEVSAHGPKQAVQTNRGWPSKNADALRLLRRESRLVTPEADALDVATDDNGAVQLHRRESRHHIRATPRTVHWGYFSRSLTPILEIESGDHVTIETLTQHAYDDYDRMICGDPDAEDVFEWTADRKGVDRRGAGPMDASVLGRGAGEGFGTQIMTGPIAIRGAVPGDTIEIEFLDITPRPCAHPEFAGRSFGSNAAAWWGFHFNDVLTDPKPRENVTIYEIFDKANPPHARPVYSYRWTQQTDPFGIPHPTIDYPGIPVARSSIAIVDLAESKTRIPLRPHFGVVGVAPKEADLVDSIPPSYFGGNLDNWRLGKGARIFLPVLVPGGLLSIGDPHAAQGDSELGGTAIECSMTGYVRIVLHKKGGALDKPIRDLSYPLIETDESWIVTGFSHANYLVELGEKAQSEIYRKSSIDLAMKDAFRKMRRFLMVNFAISEDEAISIMSVAVDFGISQVVDGNWGVHAILPKSVVAL